MRFFWGNITSGTLVGEYGVIIGKLPAVPPYAPVATNFTQTTGDETPGSSGYKYGNYTIRDIPKNNIFGDNSIRCSIFLVPNATDSNHWDLITQVTEASNGHKYWLDQTLTLTLYDEFNSLHIIDHTFTDADWAISPPYDSGTMIGFIENPTGPSTYSNRYYNYYEGGELHYELTSTAGSTPENFFQPPGG